MTRDVLREKTQFPGIYKIIRRGKHDGYIVYFRVRGLGQSTKTCATLAEAKEFQGSVRDPARARRMRSLKKGRIAVADYFPTFLERKRDLTPSTRLRYEGIGKNYIATGRLARLNLIDVTRDDVEEWINDLIRDGVGKGTVEKAYRTLRAMFTQAAKEEKVPFNPASGIKTPELPGREPFFLSANQVDQVVAAADKRERALIYFLAYTGLRIGEASALRIRNLDLVRGKVTVRENSAEVGGKKVTGLTKTKKIRAVDLSDELVAEMNAYLASYGPRKADGQLDLEGYVFTGERGGQVRQNNWRERVFKPAALRAGVSRTGPRGKIVAPRVHDLRHTFASLAAANGWTLHEVKEALGHSDIAITSSLYLHLFSDDKRAKAQMLGKLIKPPVTDSTADVLELNASGAG